MEFKEELAAIIAAEEERLGVGGEEFTRRHKEIMESVELLLQQKSTPAERKQNCFDDIEVVGKLTAKSPLQ